METTGPEIASAGGDAPRRLRWRRVDFVGCAIVLLLLVWAAPLVWNRVSDALDVRPPGEVLFTGLDDSAQSMLARSIERGAPLVYRDAAFAAVPPEVRPALLYRPGLPRKTRDLAHQLDPATLAARPFFQPFLPWQRAHAPLLPLALGFAVVLILSFYAIAGTYWSRMTLFALLQMIAIVVAAVFLVPWTWIDEPVTPNLNALGFRTAAMALSDDSIPLDDPVLKAEPCLALIMGTEGDGLAHNVISEADYTVRIPMKHGVDSLNVAAAAAVAFWELRKK